MCVNRWGAISPDRSPTLTTSEWLTQAAEAGFDGAELWENHAMLASEDELRALRGSRLPLSIWSSYASFDDPDDAPPAAMAAAMSDKRHGQQGGAATAAAVGAGAGGFTCAVCYEDCAVQQRAEMPCCGTRQSTVSEP